jgi:hypothetical protein
MATRFQYVPRSSPIRAFATAHSPTRPPRFTLFHWGLSIGLAALLIAQQVIPGVLADLGSFNVLDWQNGMRLRVTTLILIGYAMIGIRGLHPVLYVSLIFAVCSLGFKAGLIRITHEPLQATAFAALIAFAGIAIRTIIRQPDPEILPLPKPPKAE